MNPAGLVRQDFRVDVDVVDVFNQSNIACNITTRLNHTTHITSCLHSTYLLQSASGSLGFFPAVLQSNTNGSLQ